MRPGAVRVPVPTPPRRAAMSRPSLVAVAALACQSACGLPAVKDNYLEFQGADTIDWTETLHSISSGQPYDGVETFGTSIRVKAGREKSPGPASDFIEGLQFDEHILGL